MDRSLVILAAGAARRYGGLKPLAPIGPRGETLLEYSAFDALRHGFDRVVLVIRPEHEALFRARLDGGLGARAPVHYAFQTLGSLPEGFEPPPDRSRPWGTVQAVLCAEPQIRGPFAVANADDLYGPRSFAALDAFFADLEIHPRAAVVGFPVAETLSESGPVSRALCHTDSTGRLTNIVELSEVWRNGRAFLYRDPQTTNVGRLTGKELVSMNLWGFSPNIFPELRRGFRSFLEEALEDAQKELVLSQWIRPLLPRLDVRLLESPEPWCGLTFPEDRRKTSDVLASRVRRGLYPDPLWG